MSEFETVLNDAAEFATLAASVSVIIGIWSPATYISFDVATDSSIAISVVEETYFVISATAKFKVYAGVSPII